MKKIKPLFVSYGGGHANIASLVYKALVKRGGCVPEVLALTVAGEIFARHEIPYTTLSQYLPLFDDRDAILRDGKKWAEMFFNSNSNMDYEECVAYLGLGCRDLRNRIGEEQAEKEFCKLGRKAVCAIEAMKTILGNIQPDVVVLTCGVRMEKAAGSAANALGIPVIRIGDLPRFEYAEYRALTCVMNEYAQKFAIHELGLSASTVFITGSPVFEENLHISPAELDDGKKKCKINDFKKMILFLEEPGMNEDMEAIEENLYKIAERNKNFLFVFKLHPNQDYCEETWLSENVLCLQEFSLKPLLHLCDVAITKDSTAGMEAAFLNKPLINVLLSPTYCDYAEFGVSERVTDLTNLERVLLLCIDPNSDICKRQAVARKSFGNAPHAADHIAELIFSVAYAHQMAKKNGVN